LDVDDYPLIVSSADLGVCLHFSSSGYDLPMKVVDMFSAGLPCLAYNYLCIDELVQDGTNGRVFKDSEELSDQIFDTLKGFKYDTKTPILAKYRENLAEFGRDSWDDQWKATMVPAVIQEEEKKGGLNKKEL
jgi:beta-1,4-mannosyltransferase